MLFTLILKDNKDFLRLYKKGKFIAGKYAVIYYTKSRNDYNRMGITAGKKIGKAVERNRAKRLIRQAYRETESILPRGYDYVIVAREAINGVKCGAVTDFMKYAAKKIK